MKIFPAQARRGLTALSFLICAGLPAIGLAQTASPAQAAFTDSSVSGLGSNRRVAITSVIVSFQASIAAIKQGGSGMFADKTSSQSVLAMEDVDPALQREIAEQAYDRLKADLTAAGFEVLSQDEVNANPVYQKITKTAGFPNPTRFGNSLGDAMLVSPAALTPYLPYSAEGSQFEATQVLYRLCFEDGGLQLHAGRPQHDVHSQHLAPALPGSPAGQGPQRPCGQGHVCGHPWPDRNEPKAQPVGRVG